MSENNLIVKCNGKEIPCKYGESLLNVLRENGIAISADCGGAKKCLKCKVKVNPKVDSDCKEFLPLEEYDEGVRLACFLKVTENLEVEVFSKNKADILSVDKRVFSGVSTIEKSVGKKILAAIDIGTTTVTTTIFNEDFEYIDTVNFLNPQKAYGADVISRINECNAGKLEEMADCLIEEIEKVLFANNVTKAIVAANNVMLHILTKTSPKSIGVSPYAPTFKELKRIAFKDMFNKGEGEIILIPSISGYVGGDVVAGVIATDVDKKDSVLFIDLGTNGEMILSANGKLFATSTAAGPAFEGGNISCGTYARKGAIAKVFEKDGQIVIDDKNADAICGSGLIDLVAVLCDMGVIEEMGSFDEESKLVNEDFSEKRIYLNDKVYLSQKDVRNVQLAKGAISCGIKSLLNQAKVKVSDLKKILIAGGFSKNLNFKSCERIGLILEGMADKCQAMGNTAILGAVMCLKDEGLLEKATNISNMATLVELGDDPEFFNNYTECLIFE